MDSRLRGNDTDFMNEFRQQIENDAAFIIEEEVNSKAIMIYADGEKQTKSALDAEKDLMCWFVQESRELNRETGYDMISDRAVATFSVRSLNRIPNGAERCLVKIQADAFSENFTTYQIVGPPKSGRTIGFVNFQLQTVSQI
jgi:hypothetical protein